MSSGINRLESNTNINISPTDFNFKISVDINSRNVLVHVPDYVGKEKV